MSKIIISCCFFLISIFSLAQIPQLGSDSTLEIATWNVCWLGDSTQGNGPSDESLQYSNVKQFCLQSNLDLLAIQEMSNPATFYQLNKDLPAYASMMSDIDQVQKTALYWKKSHFKLIQAYSYTILNDQAFNFGRAPLQVCLELNNAQKDTIFFIVLHMKAYGDQASYNRRVNASIGLKAYLEASLKNKKYVVLGDWNDDLNVSTYQKMVTPYQNLLTAGYHFPSKELTDKGKRSYAFSKVVFDHILHSQYIQDSLYIPNSTEVFDLAPNYIMNFSKSTSDHFPVYAKYKYQLPSNTSTGIELNNLKNTFTIYPNPTFDVLRIADERASVPYQIFNALGELILSGCGNLVETDKIPVGIYFIEREGFGIGRFIKQSN